MSDDHAFESLLRCPACPSPALSREPGGYRCVDCAGLYPLLDGIPCMLPSPAAALADWRQRLHGECTNAQHQASRYRSALERRNVGAAARSRLKLQAAACDDHARRLTALLGAFALGEVQIAAEMHRALDHTAPGAPGLSAYYANVHRDWVWGDAENAKSLGLVADVLGSAVVGRMLVLGAGGGRLAYDLHQTLRPQQTIALDANPLLATVAQHMFDGDTLDLYEFPLAPRDAGSHALLRRLAAPEAAAPGLRMVLGDASRAPFAAGSFDVIVTPWLIDVIDEDFASFAMRVNALLAPGGRWANTGALTFSQPDPALRYTREEVLELVAAAGFGGLRVVEDRVPYLCSPASRHGRLETVVTFCAVKELETNAAAATGGAPEWLQRTDCAIPAWPEFQVSALAMRIHGYLASLIDGQRSIDDIVQVVVGERLMTAQDAAPAVRGFVQRLYDDARSAAWR